jgi:hypothetical protein
MKSALVVGGSGFLGQSLLNVLGRGGVGTYVGKPFAGESSSMRCVQA